MAPPLRRLASASMGLTSVLKACLIRRWPAITSLSSWAELSSDRDMLGWLQWLARQDDANSSKMAEWYLDQVKNQQASTASKTSQTVTMERTNMACAYRKSNLTRQWADIGRCFLAMADILRLIWGTIADIFRSRADLQTEIIALRHQPIPLLGGLQHHYVRI